MSEFFVGVFDGSRARLFTLEEPEFPECESGPNLIEREGLINPAGELSGQELWANVKSGRNRGATGQSHSYEDHRQKHMDEFERSFAQTIATEIVNLAQTYQAHQLILVAESQTLGLVRAAIAPLLTPKLRIQELAKDLCQLKPLEIHEHLASKNLLPARKIVSGWP